MTDVNMRRDFAWVVVAYLAATLVAAVSVVTLFPDRPILSALVADVLATTVVFGFSFAFRNTSFYDPYWSVIPALLMLYWWVYFGCPLHLRWLLAALLVLAWGFRLTHNWASGWRGVDDEDWRYRNMQQQTGIFYWPVSYLGLHMMPTLWVFLGCLPLFVVCRDPGPLNFLDAVAVIVGASSLWLETRADVELRRFRDTRKSKAEVIDTGVWAACRHPNYLGELGFWLALAFFGAAADPTLWWVWVGFVSILFLFVAISIPMIEKKLEVDKPAYESYRQRVPMLVPRLTRQTALDV